MRTSQRWKPTTPAFWDFLADAEHSSENLGTLVSWRFGLNGSAFEPECDSELRPLGGKPAWDYPDMASFMSEWHSDGEGHHDVAELCGGAGDTAKLLVRRGFRAGPNFDIVCGIDLRKSSEQSALDDYLRQCLSARRAPAFPALVHSTVLSITVAGSDQDGALLH